MPRTVTLLHTSPVHVATFDGLRDRIDPTARLNHEVREDWLEQARKRGVDAALEGEISALVGNAKGPVLCTCSSLGEAAAQAGAIRIDVPMMRRAAQIGGTVLLVHVLDSTREASVALLREALEDDGRPEDHRVLGLPMLWDLFEQGEHAKFTAAIASAVCEALQEMPGIRVVVLAQASMAGAAEALNEMSVLALSSPELALQAALAAR